MRRSICLAGLAAVLMFSTGCNQQEQDDLAKAQACLDNVDQANPTSADECLAYLEKYDSQQADILKCAIYMTSGGLVENKIAQAYKVLKDNTQTDKTASYMAVLALNLPDVDSAYTKAVLANNYCQASGVPGLQYLSSLILAGTSFNKTIKGLTGSGLDISNPAAINTAVQTMLTTCTGASPPSSCTDNLPVLGATTITLADQYCHISSADQDVCASINGSVEAANGDPSKVGQALYCYLKNLHYDANSNACM